MTVPWVEPESHDHVCEDCGALFQCYAGWEPAEDADGFPRPRRVCAGGAKCEVCQQAQKGEES